jgi:zinc protease
MRRPAGTRVRAAGAGAPAPARTRGLAPVRTVLPNGAVIVAKESSATPAVTLHASIHAGTVFDPAGFGGLAHFVSRTIDRGTRTRPADTIAEELDARGVSLTVAVNRHVLGLVCTCLVEDFPHVVSVLADIVREPLFPDAEVETRRREIVTLIGQDEDNPATVALERLMALLYGPDHPYGQPARGTIASVQRVDRDALLALHASRFRPEHLTLALVGGVEPGRAIETAARAFADWTPAGPAPPGGAAPRLEPPQPAVARRVQVVPMMNKAQADIAYGFTSIARADPAFFAYTLMNNILGQYSLGGRLGDSIRERQGMAYYAFSSFDASVIPGPLTIRAGVNPTNVERAIASIDEEVRRFAADGPTEEELAESKQYLVGSMPRTLETNAGIASYLQMMEFFGLGLDYDLRVPGLLQAVTRDEVHAAARRTLDSGRAALVVAGPYDGSPA